MHSYGMCGAAHVWIPSYVYEHLVFQRGTSGVRVVENGVPQGSTVLYNVYIKPLAKILLRHGTQHHLYVDDTQLYVDLPPTVHAEAVVGHGGLSSRGQRVAL